ncbi:dihydrofolate reductase family protein [Ancylobacter sp. A5.8]|uniref:dihydrofolate reductase family protein n=1 Tax=Ancylobacter gelatini TaxID=2919920 RepID=UPI001F4E5D0F|nr:dihydrofolate reductase family protein [Ancylobacter gelatini]MCJ8142042.1 dihydrofolate reductase family protein [Ancylobacter gelatini]
MAIVGYMAASLDGYIADRDGGISWLAPFDEVDSGYADFIADIETVVMGRTTYDQVIAMGRESGAGWFYKGKRSLVVTSRPLADAPVGVEPWQEGVPALIAHLRALPGNSWIVGGAGLQDAFIAADALDRLDLFVIPVLLGDGLAMFPRNARGPRGLTLERSLALPKGMVRLTYRLGRAPQPV